MKLREWISARVKSSAESIQRQPRADVSLPTITGGWRAVYDHIDNGIIARIPACCIAYFICEWPRIVADVGVAEAWRLHPKVEGCDYVVCPDCRSGVVDAR